MDFNKEVEYRIEKWIFANLYYEEKIDEATYHKLLNKLLDDSNPPMKSIEERFDDE